MTGATLAAAADQAGNHDCADHAPNDPAPEWIARRKLAGKQPSPDQPINARVHRQNLASAWKETAVLEKARPLSDQVTSRQPSGLQPVDSVSHEIAGDFISPIESS
jgi:hypothetical protein